MHLILILRLKKMKNKSIFKDLISKIFIVKDMIQNILL